MNQLHHFDLRAIVAAILRAELTPNTPSNPTPEDKTRYAVEQTDALLAALRVKRREPEPQGWELSVRPTAWRWIHFVDGVVAHSLIVADCPQAEILETLLNARNASTPDAEAQVDRLTQEVDRLRRELEAKSAELLAAKAAPEAEAQGVVAHNCGVCLFAPMGEKLAEAKREERERIIALVESWNLKNPLGYRVGGPTLRAALEPRP